jgi:hypothetical protein
MSSSCRGRIAVYLAILAIAGATTSNASTLTVIDPNCTGFTLGGVAPNQTLACVGGPAGSVTTPKSVTIDDKFCFAYSLSGTAPNQTLVCAVASPKLVATSSRKIHSSSGLQALPLSPASVP